MDYASERQQSEETIAVSGVCKSDMRGQASYGLFGFRDHELNEVVRRKINNPIIREAC